MLESLSRSLLHRLDPETAHDLSLRSLAAIGKTPLRLAVGQAIEDKPVTCMGITFPNPVGLAAGFDKNASALDGLSAMGFGFIEVGTVTPRPQAGNPRPRLFRLSEDHAIINRMGFNNAGVDALVNNITSSRYYRRKLGVLGINIGKNKDTPNENALDDYRLCFENQHKAHQASGKYTPLVVKISPDQTPEQMEFMASAISESGFDGLICTNTTVERPLLRNTRLASENGGLSGKPLLPKANQSLSHMRACLGPAFPIIGSGGVLCGEDARSKQKAGANLLQIYTGFVYRGSPLIAEAVSAWQAAHKSTTTLA